MKRLATTFSFLLTALLFLLLLSWFLTNALNLNRFNGFFSTQLSNLTNQPVHISGDIKLALFPRPGINLQTLEIGSSDINSPYFANLEKILFKISVSQLLKGRLSFDELKVNTLTLRLHLPYIPQKDHKPLMPNFTSLFQIDSFILNEGIISIQHPNYQLTIGNFHLMAQQPNNLNHPFPLQFRGNFKLSTHAMLPLYLYNGELNFKGIMAFSSALFQTTDNPFHYLSIDGRINGSDVSLDKFKISSFFSNVRTNGTTLLFNPLHLNLNEGDSFGNLNIDTIKNQIFINQSGVNFNARTFLQNFYPNNKFGGNLDFSIHAILNYFAPQPLKTLSGNGHITIRNGVIHDFNLKAIIDYATIKLHNILNPHLNGQEHQEPLSTETIFQNKSTFKMLNVAYSLHDNLIRCNHFVFQSDKLELVGSGSFDLNSEELQSYFSAQLSTQDEQISKTQQLFGGNFPLYARGSIHHLHVAPDMTRLTPHIESMIINKVILSPAKVINNQLNNLFNFQSNSD